MNSGRRAWSAVFLVCAASLSSPGCGTAAAATLRAADVIVLGNRSQFYAGHDESFVVTPSDGTVQQVWLTPPVTVTRPSTWGALKRLYR